MSDQASETAHAELLALDQFTAATGGALHVSDILKALEQVLRQQLDVPAGLVFRYSAEQDALVLIHKWGCPLESEVVTNPLPVAGSSWTPLVHGGCSPIPSSIGDSPLAGSPFATVSEQQVVFCLPLLVQECVEGVICLLASSEAHFAGRVTFYQTLARQIGVALQNATLYQQSQASQQQLRELIQQILLVQEEERSQVSRELHDEAGQLLTALKLSLEMGREDLDALVQGDTTAAEALLQALQSALDLTEQTLNQIQMLIHRLRPTALDDLGLATAVDSYARDFNRHHNELTISFKQEGIIRPHLSASAGIALYRFLQQALNNVARHSHAEIVDITLRADSHTLSLMVRDNGSGFRPDALEQGLGLLGIRERLRAEGGRLELDTAPGKGTTLLAWIPLEAHI